MARSRRFYWYHVQLFFAAVLQFLVVFAPLSYAGNWRTHQTAFLHPFWIYSETVDFARQSFASDLTWFVQRPELILLVVWMLGLGFLLLWILFAKADQSRKAGLLRKAIGGFAVQIALAYLVAQSVTWHVTDTVGSEEVQLRVLPQFLLLLFPLFFSYMAWNRMRKQLPSH